MLDRDAQQMIAFGLMVMFIAIGIGSCMHLAN
jgi:hypothetical protein